MGNRARTSNEQFLTPRDAAARLGVNLNAMYGMLNRGEIPALKLGGRFYIHRELFEAMLNPKAGAAVVEVLKAFNG